MDKDQERTEKPQDTQRNEPDTQRNEPDIISHSDPREIQRRDLEIQERMNVEGPPIEPPSRGDSDQGGKDGSSEGESKD